MSDDPVVETINAILAGEDNFILLVQRDQLERIRDEIVGLRRRVERLREAHRESQHAANIDIPARVRAEALEEAARGAEYGGGPVGASIAASIRAMKDKRDDQK